MSDKYEGGQTIPSFVRDIYSPSSSAAKIVEVPGKLQKLFAYNSNNDIEYKGVAARGLATSSNGWLIFNFTWSGSNCTEIKTADGAWDDRSSLTYE